MPADQRPPEQDAEDGRLALDVLRGLAAEELARSERTVSRGRQAFGLVAGVFAVAQTVAFGSFDARLITGYQRHVILGGAIAAGVGLVACAVVLVLSSRALDFGNIDTSDLLAMADDARDGGDPFEDQLVGKYATLVDKRRRANKELLGRVACTQGVALLAVGLTLVELIYSLQARL